MGKSREFRKIRQEARRNAARVLREFNDSFKVEDYIKPRPVWIPKCIWNLIIELVIKS